MSTYKGITIGELLAKLKITKQSLNRILRDLIKIDVITFKKGSKDTRVKHVYLNEKGEKIFEEIFSKQKKRIYSALLSSSAKEVVDFNNVLKKLINSNERIWSTYFSFVDDDKGIRELVKEYLDQNNFITTTAKDASDALEKTKLIKFDLIILDIMMPGMSGLEFLRENKNILDTPIILLTAKGEANDRIAGLEKGADDYLPKPFEPKELILRIKNILNKTNITKDKNEIEFGNVKINLNKMLIFKNNRQIKINNTEKKFLRKWLIHQAKSLLGTV